MKYGTSTKKITTSRKDAQEKTATALLTKGLKKKWKQPCGYKEKEEVNQLKQATDKEAPLALGPPPSASRAVENKSKLKGRRRSRSQSPAVPNNTDRREAKKKQ